MSRAGRLLKHCSEIALAVPLGGLGRLEWRPVVLDATDLARHPRDGDPASRAAHSLRLAFIQNAAGETAAARESIARASDALAAMKEDYRKSSLTVELAVLQARIRDLSGVITSYRRLGADTIGSGPPVSSSMPSSTRATPRGPPNSSRNCRRTANITKTRSTTGSLGPSRTSGLLGWRSGLLGGSPSQSGGFGRFATWR